MLALILSASVVAAQDAVIRVDAGKVENKITPYLYGACMEDVNHEIYGEFMISRFLARALRNLPPWITLSGLPGAKGYGRCKMINFPYRRIRGEIGL